MEKQHQFIDADGHVIEPEDIWENYLEPAFRSEMPFTRFKYAGNPLTITEEIRVAGDVLPASGVAGFPTPVPPDAAYEEAARQGFPPHFYIEAMDRVGIDYMGQALMQGAETEQEKLAAAPPAVAGLRPCSNQHAVTVLVAPVPRAGSVRGLRPSRWSPRTASCRNRG
jgi:hypothetical protein